MEPNQLIVELHTFRHPTDEQLRLITTVDISSNNRLLSVWQQILKTV